MVPVSIFALGTYSIQNTTFINQFDIKDWRNRYWPHFNMDVDEDLQNISLIDGMFKIKHGICIE